MQTEHGGFWEGLEGNIERMALLAGPIQGGPFALLGTLVFAPVAEFFSLLIKNNVRGSEGLRTAVQGAVLMFGVNARRYEHGNRDSLLLERISVELNAGKGVTR